MDQAPNAINSSNHHLDLDHNETTTQSRETIAFLSTAFNQGIPLCDRTSRGVANILNDIDEKLGRTQLSSATH